MLSNPVYFKPFRGARREVSGATLEREGAAREEEDTRTFLQVLWRWLVNGPFIREVFAVEDFNYRASSWICTK